MGKVTVFNNLTLDGVMQAPGRPDEDTRGGFPYGGWGAPYAAMMEADRDMSGNGNLLMGRRTYEDFYTVWPNRKDGNPFTDVLNKMQKYVASTTLKEPLPWQNSTLLKGDAADAIAKLKNEDVGDFLILGSGVLIQSLMKRNLIDTYILLIHPLVLGTGRHLFTDGGADAKLRLTNSKTTSKGVVIATYVPVEP